MYIIKSPNVIFKKAMVKRKLNQIYAIVIHHSACEDRTVGEINSMHINRGFAGIGYHFYVTKSGRVYMGRPVEFIGAHCKGHNKHTIGICLEGDLTKRRATEPQLQALFVLIKYLYNKYPTITETYEHRQLAPTLCPGYAITKDLIAIKNAYNEEVIDNEDED